MLQKTSILTALQRDTSSTTFIPQIDGLRFVAIGAVIAYHVADFVRVKTGHDWTDSGFSLFLSHGYFGVPLFFVISGFVISLPFVERAMTNKPAPSLKRYFLRRLTRLEPPYLINLLLLFALLIFVKEHSAQDLLPHLAASATYTHGAIYNTFSEINFLAWSLEVEFQFYALAPLLVLVFRIGNLPLRRMLLVASILAAGLWANGLHAAWPMPRFSVLYYIGYFFAGFLLADVYVNDWQEQPRTRRRFDLVTLACWGLLAAALYEPDRYRSLLAPLVFGAYWAAFRGTLSSWLFSRPPIYIIGGMCYTLYLYHFYVVSAVGNLALQWIVKPTDDLAMATAVTLVIVVPVVLLSGAILFVLFEKPFMRRTWFERFMLWFNRQFTRRVLPRDTPAS